MKITIKHDNRLRYIKEIAKKISNDEKVQSQIVNFLFLLVITHKILDIRHIPSAFVLLDRYVNNNGFGFNTDEIFLGFVTAIILVIKLNNDSDLDNYSYQIVLNNHCSSNISTKLINSLVLIFLKTIKWETHITVEDIQHIETNNNLKLVYT